MSIEAQVSLLAMQKLYTIAQKLDNRELVQSLGNYLKSFELI